jgi:hypothetical protein
MHVRAPGDERYKSAYRPYKACQQKAFTSVSTEKNFSPAQKTQKTSFPYF